jgi:glutamate decarboxylase
MPLDLLDRLISDLCAATETLMGLKDFDLAAWQPFPKKESSTAASDESGNRSSTSKMDSGIHRSVC